MINMADETNNSKPTNTNTNLTDGNLTDGNLTEDALNELVARTIEATNKQLNKTDVLPTTLGGNEQLPASSSTSNSASNSTLPVPELGDLNTNQSNSGASTLPPVGSQDPAIDQNAAEIAPSAAVNEETPKTIAIKKATDRLDDAEAQLTAANDKQDNGAMTSANEEIVAAKKELEDANNMSGGRRRTKHKKHNKRGGKKSHKKGKSSKKVAKRRKSRKTGSRRSRKQNKH